MNEAIEDSGHILLWQIINIIGLIIIVYVLYLLIKFLRNKYRK
jgi:uncharacterized membrane protein